MCASQFRDEVENVLIQFQTCIKQCDTNDDCELLAVIQLLLSSVKVMIKQCENVP